LGLRGNPLRHRFVAQEMPRICTKLLDPRYGAAREREANAVDLRKALDPRYERLRNEKQMPRICKNR
jgi:hypothetical protein